MRETLSKACETAHSAVRESPRRVAIVGVILMLLAGGVAAQTGTQTWQDDFSDGDVDGWVGENVTAVNESVTGTGYSLHQADGYGTLEDSAQWTDGPTLDISEGFEINATVKSNQGTGLNRRTAIGIIDSRDEGAMIVFSAEYDATWLSNDTGAEPTADALPTDFNDTWVDIRIESPENESTLRAKIWEHGTAEPADWQMTVNYTAESGPFVVRPGPVEEPGRAITLDQIKITGQETTDRELSLDTRSLVQPGGTHPYSVVLEDVGDVTDGATVTSSNDSILSVNEQNHTLTAVNDSNVSETVTVQAEYDGEVIRQEVVVAEPTVENLQILPGIWRFYAILDDSTMFALLIATLLSVPAARFTSAFGGLAVSEMVIVGFWFAGYIEYGFAAVSVFVAMFIGLNLAANIDYQVRR